IGSLLAALTLITSSRAVAQLYRLAEMNTEQIRALDRARTVIIMPGGILEQHGPYLPSYSDGYYTRASPLISPRRSSSDRVGRSCSFRKSR
ncbi:MAG: hypothetical protein ACREOG_22370, partial [Gemmatimonadaceae bacterium]